MTGTRRFEPLSTDVRMPAATTGNGNLPAHTEIDHALSPKALTALEESVPASTRRAYAHDWKAFTAWCETEGRVPLAATPETVIEYVTDLTTTPLRKTGRTPAPATVERALAAIRTMHRLSSVPPPETKGARKVLDGYRARLALSGAPGATPRRSGAAVPRQLRKMVGTLNRSTLAGKRDAVILVLGYAVAGRVSELSALNIEQIREVDEGLLVRVYRRKIKRWTECHVPYGSNPATCPVRATRSLLTALADVGRTSGPLFVRVDKHGRVAPPMTRNGRPIGDPTGRMTAEAIGDVIARAADAAGLEGQWTGHALRRGFATAARRDKRPVETIARHAGWADNSRALLGYIEDADMWTDNPVTGL